MANIKSYPNNIDQYIGAEEVMKWHHGRTSGVFAAGSNCVVEPVTNSMAVTVSDGCGWLTDASGNGITWWNDNYKQQGSKLQLTLDAAESTGTLGRIDRVIVEWTIGNYDNVPVIRILKGTSASSPSAPALTNDSTVRQISLAKISISAAATAITALDITDERTDTTVCGLVTESVSADTTLIYQQYVEALALLRSAISQAWSGVISDGAITTAKLADNSVSAAKLKDYCVTTAKLDNQAVTTSEIRQNTIKAENINRSDFSQNMFSVSTYTESVSLSGNSQSSYTISLTKTNYRVLGIVGVNVGNTSLRVGNAGLTLDASTAIVNVVNSSSSAISSNITLFVLYAKNA